MKWPLTPDFFTDQQLFTRSQVARRSFTVQQATRLQFTIERQVFIL